MPRFPSGVVSVFELASEFQGEQHFAMSSYSGFSAFAFVATIFGVIHAILFIVIAWRAMRAHERIADAAAEWIGRNRPPAPQHPIYPAPKFPKPETPSY